MPMLQSGKRLPYCVLILLSILLYGCSSNIGQPANSSGTTTTGVPSSSEVISVSGTHLLRDGVIWAPHGLNSVAFNAAPSVRTGLFGQAYDNFSATEVAAMKNWGNDTIRFFVSQPGLDPNDPAYSPDFLGEIVTGVKMARATGMNVIVCVQDEKLSGTSTDTPTQLPNMGTGNAWSVLAKAFKSDNGIMFEIMNEPQPPVIDPQTGASNWPAWATAMNNMITIIRNTGATNVVVADGLSFAEQLDGAPVLADPLHQVAYASHPYAHSSFDQTAKGNGQPGVGWDAKFGNVSVSSFAPVLVSEWSLENDETPPSPPVIPFQYCDVNSGQAALNMLSYLQSKGIGLLAIAYDLPNNKYFVAGNASPMGRVGRATVDEEATPTTVVGTGCSDPTFGPGIMIQNWYRTGIVPPALE